MARHYIKVRSFAELFIQVGSILNDDRDAKIVGSLSRERR